MKNDVRKKEDDLDLHPRTVPIGTKIRFEFFSLLLVIRIHFFHVVHRNQVKEGLEDPDPIPPPDLRQRKENAIAIEIKKIEKRTEAGIEIEIKTMKEIVEVEVGIFLVQNQRKTWNHLLKMYQARIN